MGNTTIPAELVAINAIQGTLIADNAITAVHIGQNQVHSVQLAINSVTATQIADSTITSAKIADGTIVTADIADGQITTAKLVDSSVTSAKIAAGTIVGGDIANNAILTQHIDDNQITADQIADNAVGLGQMAGLTRGSIIYGDSAGDPAYLAAGTSGHVLTSDGTDISWTADTDLFLASSGGTVTGNVIISGGSLTATNTATTIHRLNSTSNNTRSILRLDSKDSSGNSVEIRMHSLGDGPRGEIFTYTNHDLGFATNNAAPQMILNTSGNVGIGTSTVGYRLDVKSASGTDTVLNVRNPSTSWGEYALARFQTDTKDTRFIELGYYRGTAESNRAFIVNGQSSNRLLTVLESSGNVGIGDTSPSTKLEVLDANGVGLRFGDIASTPSSQTAGYIGMSTSAYSGNNGDLVLIPRTSATSRILLMEGNVGIGTTSPTKSLSVKAPSGSNGGIDVFHNNGNKVAELVHHGSGDEGRLSLYDGGVGTIQLHGESGQDSYINSGNVGIGTSSPSSAAGFDAKLQLESANPMLVYKETDQSNKWEVGAWGGNYVIWNGTNERMRIDSAGDVLIGTTSNSYNRGKFTVFGTPGNPATSGTNPDNVAIRVATTTGNSQSFDIGMYNTGDYGAWLQASNSGALDSHSPIVLNPNGGNVGIGDTSPSQRLSVSGTGSVPPARFTATGNTNTLEVWGNATASTSTGLLCNAGTNEFDYSAKFRNYAGSTIMEVRGDSVIDIFGTTRLQDNTILALGQSSDARIYYDGTNSLYITASNGTANTVNITANNFQIGGATPLISGTANDSVVINQDGASNVDFRVESDNEQYNFFCDASSEIIHFGEGTNSDTQQVLPAGTLAGRRHGYHGGNRTHAGQTFKYSEGTSWTDAIKIDWNNASWGGVCMRITGMYNYSASNNFSIVIGLAGYSAYGSVSYDATSNGVLNWTTAIQLAQTATGETMIRQRAADSTGDVVYRYEWQIYNRSNQTILIVEQ